MERLQKIIAASGLCSRRMAEQWIQAGRVQCNGRVCALGESADPKCDEILVDGKPLPSTGDKLYIMLNKPRGFVTTLSDEKGRKDVTQLVADCGGRVYPVGRLDMDSEGLLLLTNDGGFANRLMHPSHEVDKVYRVIVRNFTEEGLAKLGRAVRIDGYMIRKPDVQILEKLDDDRVALKVTIHEGRNRQVRRMCAMAGMPVFRLCRVQEGELLLGDLPKGSWRYLTAEEVSALMK